MASELINSTSLIDPTESVSSAQQKLDIWVRYGSPKRVYATSEVTDAIDTWDLVSGTPSDSSLAEIVLLDTANTDLDLPIVADNLGRVLTIRNIGSTSSDINADGSDVIDTSGTPAATYALAADASITIVAAEVLGGNPTWFQIG